VGGEESWDGCLRLKLQTFYPEEKEERSSTSILLFFFLSVGDVSSS
jgi:hypothetical protein